jgi:hypothetical protein
MIFYAYRKVTERERDKKVSERQTKRTTWDMILLSQDSSVEHFPAISFRFQLICFSFLLHLIIRFHVLTVCVRHN